MDIWMLPLLALAGVLAGWLNVLAGGGSMVSVLAMLFMGIPGPIANGTFRVAILAQNFTAVTSFRQRGFSDFRLSFSLAAAASVGAVAGAMVGVQLSGLWFNRALGLVMVGVLVLMATDWGRATPQLAEETPGGPKNLVLGHILMVGAGLWGGFIQIGVGFIFMPILARVMGIDLVRVNMHKVFIVMVYTSIALLVFASQGGVLWSAGLALAFGHAIGAWLGVRSAVLKGDKLIRRVFMLMISALVVKLLFFP
ncbi:UPF0721 transmembrane protein [Iodidimonas gelatinilytica]|uniref:Probable membrane transporter protein n=1 Tax=Iodidimonas gelatinilytica TaxID=1236966 RepID=A0A5A7N0T2_9PROT|nr:sulfite exporter TauE/SafE family protein [Iodidimonas gelatinilytica]GER01728.1 UPF0721 transmembrane protein [Iodidimonas gelatinilytica]